MVYIVVCVISAFAGGFIGRRKGSSFLLWFLIGLFVPVLGPIAAVLYRNERDELRRQCPSCGAILMLHDAKCTRCGHELEFPDVAIEPASRAAGQQM